MSDLPFALAAESVIQLLAWWQSDGRKVPAQKPWMFPIGGAWPSADETLDPYGIWIAEVMRCSAA